MVEVPSHGWGESKPNSSPAWKRDSKEVPWELQPGDSRFDLLSLQVDIFCKCQHLTLPMEAESQAGFLRHVLSKEDAVGKAKFFFSLICADPVALPHRSRLMKPLGSASLRCCKFCTHIASFLQQRFLSGTLTQALQAGGSKTQRHQLDSDLGTRVSCGAPW